MHVGSLCDIVTMKILNAKGVCVSWYFFFEMIEDNLGFINVIILQFSERNNGCFFYSIKVFYPCPILFHLHGFLRSKGELRSLSLYIYNKNMNFFIRRVAIGGDVGATYPKQCVLLNNYLLHNEQYYLSHSVYTYFITFTYILMFFLKYIY